MAIGRGFDHLRRQNAKTGGGARGSGYYKMWLKPGERARFWFMLDGDEMPGPLIHLVEKKLRTPKPDGRGGTRTTWTKDVGCGKLDYDDDQPCAICDLGDAPGFKGPFPRLVVPLYVEDVVHTAPGSTKDANGLDQPWEPKGSADGPVYIEHVNGVWLLIAKSRLTEQIEDAYNVGDPLAEGNEDRERTLLDRAWVIKKTGTGQQQSESLEGRAPSEMPEAVREAIAALPDIDDIIDKEFADDTQGRQKQEQSRQASSSSSSYDADRIPSKSDFVAGDDDFDEDW